MNPRVVGIDPSLTSTGVAMPDGRTLSIRPRIKVPKDAPGTVRVRRVADIAAQLGLILRPHRDNIDIAVVEHYLLKGPGGPWTLIRLVEIGLAIRVVLDQLRIPFVEVPPTTLKSLMAGHGGADKPEIIRAARELGGAPANDDEADAYLLRGMALRWYGDWTQLSDKERLRLGDFDWPDLKEPTHV